MEKKVKKVDKAFFEAEKNGQKYKDIVIIYPFCYVTDNGKNYFRYLEDGRYEYLSFENSNCTFSFGCRAASIESLMADDQFYFKVLANQNTIISLEEFEFRRSLVMAEYDKYLKGDKYLSFAVENLIKQKELEEKEKQKNNSTSEDIISSNNNDDEPF